MAETCEVYWSMPHRSVHFRGGLVGRVGGLIEALGEQLMRVGWVQEEDLPVWETGRPLALPVLVAYRSGRCFPQDCGLSRGDLHGQQIQPPGPGTGRAYECVMGEPVRHPIPEVRIQGGESETT